MPWLTASRAACVAGGVACLVFAGSLGNDWALDDHPIIERNQAAHSPAAALGAWFDPYWPPEDGLSAGLYRPITVLSYGIDWLVSGGRPWWFHLVNVVLHALVTGLVVLVAAAWLAPIGALAAGLVFAVHPVHVEAVANVVGRAEVMAAGGLLVAVLAARRYRHDATKGRWRWLTLSVVAVAAAQLSKEHAVVALAILAVDHLLDPAPGESAADLYTAVAAVTVGFVFLWNAVSGAMTDVAAAVPLRDLTVPERLAAVFPVQLDVTRLLVWPGDLAPEYGPELIPVRTAWSGLATVGLVFSAAVLLLAVLLRRRAPVVSFGVLAGAVSYLPTSNLLFVSGVVLAERALYLAALSPAMVIGWMVHRALEAGRYRAVAWTALGVVLITFAVRSVSRVPFWRDTRTVVIEGFIAHPESFPAQVRLARAREQAGDIPGAIAQYYSAITLYDGYSVVAVTAARLALEAGRPTFAEHLATIAARRDPDHPVVARLVADLHLRAGRPDSALAVAARLVDSRPTNLAALETYVSLLGQVPAPEWQRLLAQARLEWRRGLLIKATASLDSAAVVLSPPTGPGECSELRATLPLAQTLAPQRVAVFRAPLVTVAAANAWCRDDDV